MREAERRKLIFDKLLSFDFDFKNKLVLEVPSSVSPQFGVGSVEVLEYKPQNVVVKTSSNQPKLLFLSDNYFAGWEAEVDGNRVPILRSNYTFRSVALTPGEHTVRFFYENRNFKVGLILSGVSLMIIIVFLLKRPRLY